MHRPQYIFTSQRLGFRNWVEADIAPFAEMNADAEVMKYFPSVITLNETEALVERMQQLYAEKGYCYFAVDTLHDNKFIGFIGLADKTFEADFTPCIDIGWRLAQHAWGKGYATEGAKRCLEYAFNELGLNKVVSICPAGNTPSEAVMKKIGLKKMGNFVHPLLLSNERLRDCVLYEILQT